MQKVSIIIINWNGRKDTIECLESLYRIDYQNFEVILVDNFSTNDSIEKIKDWAMKNIEVESNYFKKTKCTHQLQIYEYTNNDLKSGNYYLIKKEFDTLASNKKLFLLKNDKNYGFAGGNNVAIQQVLSENISDSILLLNNDTIVQKTFLNELIHAIEMEKSLGIIGPKILNYTSSDSIQTIQSLGGFVNLWSGNVNMISGGWKDFTSDNKEVAYLRGASILIKTKVFKAVGILEEKYFAYFEETDLCMKAKKQGFSINIIPSSFIRHKGMASFGRISGFSLYLMTRNLFWFEKRYASTFQIIIFYIYFFIVKFPRKILYISIFGKSKKEILMKYLTGVRDGIISKI